ncbi:MAG: molybdopterin molybdotransferase MoeA, partial [Cyanobacteria bacterium P01_H01_bin.130]
MLSVAEAEARILALCVPLAGVGDAGVGDTEIVPLGQARGRVLAEAVLAARDVPHWDNSAMDGYAVRSQDCQSGSESGSESEQGLAVIDELPAGTEPRQVLQAGQAARIFTGGVLPAGADAVVMQEETERRGDRVLIQATVEAGQFIREQGKYCRAGTPILSPGMVLGPAELAIAAANQTAELTVIRRPRVAVLSTGNELVSVDAPLQPGQIVDSNRYALTAFVEQMGAIAIPLGIVGDRRETVTAAIREAIFSADIVLSTGGVSVGDYDYVEAVLEELGGAIAVRKVAVKPGKPLTVAQFSAETLQSLGFD